MVIWVIFYFFALVNNVAVNNLVHVFFIVMETDFNRDLRVICIEVYDLREIFYCHVEGHISVGIRNFLCAYEKLFFLRYRLNLPYVFTLVLLPLQLF